MTGPRAEPLVIATSASDVLTVECLSDGAVTIHVWRERLCLPGRAVRPLAVALAHLDSVSLPGEDGHQHRVDDELLISLQADAAVVIAFGVDPGPVCAIEVPGVQVDRLRRTLEGIAR